MTIKNKIQILEDIAFFIRTTTLGTILKANNGHVGGNLSSVELLTALYFGGLFKFDPNNSKNKNRDRVLIRGHEGPLRYTIFALLGYIEFEELDSYRQLGSRLQGHEDMHITPGVDITPSGSLGMLLSYGVGSAIANKDKNIDSKTIVFLGDGEEQEGNVSEAARHAGNLKLDNLVCIIDKNKKQLSGETRFSDCNSDLFKIWQGYGWDVFEIKDGNNIKEVIAVYEKLKNITKPTMVIANTIKGCGIKSAKEHFNGYHTLSSAKQEDKVEISKTYMQMQETLKKKNLNFENVSKLAKSLVIIPKENKEIYDYVDDSIYDIRIENSGINVEEAEDKYLMELKKRILKSNKKSNMYFITPDLIRKDIEAIAEFPKFTHFINAGIREQHVIAMSHGISVENPEARIFVCCGDAFAFRSLDQLNAAATGGSNILVVGENAGIFQGFNGKTHQTVSQPGAVMAIPEINLFEPGDNVDLYNVFSECLCNNKGVNYVRLHHGTLNLTRKDNNKKNTGAYFIHKSKKRPKLVIVSSGFTGENAVKAAVTLEKNYNCPTNVINLVNVKKFSEYAEELLINNAPIITVYNGNPKILSEKVADAIFTNSKIKKPDFIKAHGFIEGTSGKVDDLIKHYKLDCEGIVKFILKGVLEKND